MKQIIYLGDIHGNFTRLKAEIERLKLGNNEEITYIIQVGDFGIGFDNKHDINNLLHLNKFFKLRNIVFLAIRGNHDDPSFFKGNHMYSNLKLLEDYTVMDIYDKKHLFVGGAVSIDRNGRAYEDQIRAAAGGSQLSYWEDEVFKLDEEKLQNISGIDIIVTHTAPEWCFPDNRNGFGDFVQRFANYDEYLLEDLTKERADVSRMFEILSTNNWSTHFYGHFHNKKTENFGNKTHILLHIDEFKEI